jgi:hypothetical protein
MAQLFGCDRNNSPATNWDPSADDEKEFHNAEDKFPLGIVFEVQLIPELVEVQTKLGLCPARAANLVPSADETTRRQAMFGALVCVQVWASAKLAVSKAVRTTSRILKVFIGRSERASFIQPFYEIIVKAAIFL